MSSEAQLDDVKQPDAGGELELEGESTRDLPALLQDDSPQKLTKQDTAPRWAAALRGIAGAVAESFSRVSSSATELFRDKDLRK